MPWPATQRGFTLLEMIAVIILLAIAATLVSFAVTRGLEAARAREAGRDLTLALRAVRTQAITERHTARLDVDLARRSYQRPGQAPHLLPAGMGLHMTTAAALHEGTLAAVAFFPDGSSTGGNIRLEKDGRVWRIDIAWLTGLVQWQEVQP